ncbi:hypothetical protein [Pseudoduganella sp.]|uniref:hypothetical protein n=1 Tax=Pseudoduganella sp. TaxID=1880898 RepID=UPI0035B38B2C
MRYIVRNAKVAILCLLLASVASAADNSPRLLRDPLLGLRYDRTLVNFERLSPQQLAPCPTLADRDSIKSNWYVFAMARTANAGAYYLVGGYSIRTHPYPPEIPRYELDDAGVIFSISGERCVVFEAPARAMFEPLLAGEIPEPILLALANDHASRMVQAYQGSSQLRAAMRKQGISVQALPGTLREAYSVILK